MMTAKRLKVNDAPNLRRFRAEIQNMTCSNRHFRRPGPKQTRKERRKEARLEKKSRKNAYFRKQHVPSKDELERLKLETERQQQEEIKKKKIERAKQKKQARLERKKQMVAESHAEQSCLENLWDDREIRDLEKKLGLSRRKKDTLPASFKNDGLDYILDVADSDKLQTVMGMEEETGDDFSLGESNSGTDVEDGSDASGEDDWEGKLAGGTKKAKEVVLQKSFDQEKQISDPADQKEKWEELVDRIKKISEKKRKKKTVKFANKSEEAEKTESDVESDREDPDMQEGTDDDDDDDDDGDDDEDEDMFATGSDGDIDYEDDSGEDHDFGKDDDHSDGGDSDDIPEEEIGDKLQIKRKHGSDTVEDLKEDIYGRLRDSQGNVVRDSKPAGGNEAYIPPAKRLQMLQAGDDKKQLQLERLKKQLKGLVNRASENNMQPISGQIEELYLSNSRADVTETLVALVLEACITPVLTPERLSMELMMLVAILHGNVGSEVGAVFLQHFVTRFEQLSQEPDYGVGKIMDNVLLLIAHLYNFKVVHSVLIFDILQKLTEHFTEKDIELILLLLRHVGFSLRKDSPAELKNFIVKVQAKASDQGAVVDQSRVGFMLDVILAIRNNNMRKIPNYDPEHLEHLRKLIRQYIRGSFGDNQLHISLQDLLNADKKGKWWLVGSAWEGTLSLPAPVANKSSSVVSQLEVSSKLQDLARRQRMNTDLRRNIFFVIMTSEDYLDAFGKLLRLGLKSSQQQETILVILDCCLQEKTYNPFYSYLCQKFCEHHRTYQMAFQFCVWDRFKEISNLRDTNRYNLAKMLSHLIINKAVSLSILKVITFGTLEKSMVHLLKQLMSEILLDHPVSDIEAAFTRIVHIDKLKTLCEGLRLFIRHFLAGKKRESKGAKLTERVEVVDRILSRGKSHVLL